MVVQIQSISCVCLENLKPHVDLTGTVGHWREVYVSIFPRICLPGLHNSPGSSTISCSCKKSYKGKENSKARDTKIVLKDQEETKHGSRTVV